MAATHIIRGFGTAIRNLRMTALLWAWSFALAAVAALPAWHWWNSVLSPSGGADVLLERFHLGTVAEIAQYDRSPVWSIVIIAVIGIGLVAAVANAFVAGGMLEILLSRERREVWHRFFAGAGRYFTRFALLLLISLAAAGVVLGVLSALIEAVGRASAKSGWEHAPAVLGVFRIMIAALVVGFFYLALDYSRIQIARHGDRRVLRAWVSGVSFVARNLLRTFGLLAGVLIGLGLLFAVYALLRQYIPAHTGALIFLMFVLQQATMFARTGLRVALLAGEVDLHFFVSPPVTEPVPDPELEGERHPEAQHTGDPTPGSLDPDPYSGELRP